ncbi:unnamed protein product [Linum tenue]|uniref:CCHC-type domain-containing protein n=1 Tax=Linum tenue TaxID=586396 RepID=A0AAV0KXA7_9ROSI|nr:unnamed protein product [Linum tenue]
MIVWLQLPDLPIHLYHKEVLISIGNLLGRTIKLDYHTLNQQRAKFARLAVEINLEKPLIPRVHLDGEWQKIEYENLPEVCFKCGKVGHSSTSCPKLRLVLQGERPTVAGILNSDSSAPAVTEPSADFGPWLIVSRKSRRNNRDQNRKGKEEMDVGKQSQGNGYKDGKNRSFKKESRDMNGRPHLPQLASQRATNYVKKIPTAGKNKEAPRKGKEKVISEEASSSKELLGPGPSFPSNSRLKPIRDSAGTSCSSPLVANGQPVPPPS